MFSTITEKGISLQDEVQSKIKNNTYFTFEIVLHIMIDITRIALFLANKKLVHYFFSPSKIIKIDDSK